MSELIKWTPSQILSEQFPEISNLEIYGTCDTPLFNSKDVESLLEMCRQHYSRDYVVGKDYVKIYVKTTDIQSHETIVLTERGLYTLIFKSKTQVAEKFKDFVTIVLRELRTSGHVELSAAINKLHLYEKQMDNEHQLMQKYQGESERYYLKYNSMWMENQVLKDKVNNELENKKDPTYQIQSFKERFFKRVYVYVSKPPKPVEDEFETWDPDIDPTEDEEICFSISSKKRVVGSTAEMYLDPLVTFGQLKEKLAELEFSVKLTNERTHDTIFRGTLENLRNIIDDLST